MKTSLISVPELQIKIKSTLFRFQVEVNKVADRDRETESILLSNNLNFCHGSKKYFCINLRGQNQMSFAILLISESAVSTPVNYYLQIDQIGSPSNYIKIYALIRKILELPN